VHYLREIILIATVVCIQEFIRNQLSVAICKFKGVIHL